jgi:hypothetical protein
MRGAHREEHVIEVVEIVDLGYEKCPKNNPMKEEDDDSTLSDHKTSDVIVTMRSKWAAQMPDRSSKATLIETV